MRYVNMQHLMMAWPIENLSTSRLKDVADDRN